MNISREFKKDAFWGTVAGLGFLFSGWWLLSLAALGFWLARLHGLEARKQYFLAGWLFGTCKSMVVLSWFWSAYPATWLGLEAGPLHFLVVLLYWIPAGLTLGLGTALFAGVYFSIQKQSKKVYLWIPAAGLLWVVGEVLGAYIFSLYTIGQHAGLTAGFSFGHFGYVVAASDFLVHIAAWGGVYVLSFVAFLAVAGVVTQTRTSHRVVLAIIFILCFLVPISEGREMVGEQVLLVESRFTADSGLSRAELEHIKFDLVKTALESDVETILLPEDFRFTRYFSEPEEVLRYMHNLSKEPKVLIDTTTVVQGRNRILRAYVYDTNDDTVTSFDKGYYVPQGEYIPYVYQVVIKLLSLPEETERLLAENGGYYSEKEQGATEFSERVPPILFCFESVTPLGSQQVTKGRESVSYIAHPTSHGWFQHHQKILWNQLTAMLRVQSAWAGVPIVQSGNTNPAQVISMQGLVETKVLIDTQWWKLVEVSL